MVQKEIETVKKAERDAVKSIEEAEKKKEWMRIPNPPQR